MKQITKPDLIAFLEKFKTSDPSSNYNDDKTMIAVGHALSDCGFDQQLANLLIGALVNKGPIFTAASLWATGFQMGREFEFSKKEADELSRLWEIETPKRKRSGIKKRA